MSSSHSSSRSSWISNVITLFVLVGLGMLVVYLFGTILTGLLEIHLALWQSDLLNFAIGVLVVVAATSAQEVIKDVVARRSTKAQKIKAEYQKLAEQHPELVTLLTLLEETGSRSFWSSFWTSAAQNAIFTLIGLLAGVVLSSAHFG